MLAWHVPAADPWPAAGMCSSLRRLTPNTAACCNLQVLPAAQKVCLLPVVTRHSHTSARARAAYQGIFSPAGCLLANRATCKGTITLHPAILCGVRHPHACRAYSHTRHHGAGCHQSINSGTWPAPPQHKRTYKCRLRCSIHNAPPKKSPARSATAAAAAAQCAQVCTPPAAPCLNEAAEGA